MKVNRPYATTYECETCGCGETRLGECQCVCHAINLKPTQSFTVPVFAESEKRFAERVYTICKRDVR